MNKVIANDTNNNFIVNSNSSTTPLLSGETFTGVWTDIYKFSSISIVYKSDVAGALVWQASTDGVNVDATAVMSATETSGLHSLIPVTRYGRVVYTNNGTDQTFFRIQMILNENPRIAMPTSRSVQPFNDTTDVINVRSVITAQQLNGSYSNVPANEQGFLKVSSGSYDSLNNSLVQQITPTVQNYFIYGVPLHTQLSVQFTATGGTITTSTEKNAINLNITTAIGSFAVQRSRRVVKHYPGYGNGISHQAKFDGNAVANSLQFVGVGNSETDIYFCYTGDVFGCRYSSGGKLHIVSLLITTASTGATNATVTLNSVAFTVPLTNAGGDLEFTAHEISKGVGGAGFTGWDVEHIGTTVFFIAGSVGARSGTYSFTHASAVAAFTTGEVGAALNTTFIPRTSWNGVSPLIADLDPTKVNIYQIEYSWFGSANLLYKVFNSTSRQYELVHSVSFANVVSSLGISKPNMYLQKGVASLGSTTALTLFSSSSFAGTYGMLKLQDSPIVSVSNTRSISSSTQTNVLVLQCAKLLNNTATQSEIFLETLTVASDGNRAVRIRVILNPTTLGADTTGDYDTFTYINPTQSLTLYDTTSLTYTGGTVLREYIVGKDGNLIINLFREDLYLGRGDILVFSAFSTAVNVVDIAVSVRENY